MIGKTISHYRILDKIGEGGMGVVFKAEDTKLHRVVGLKFLRPDALENEELKLRFLHEAEAAAALNHPNICTVYDIDEAEGRAFIVMERIEGESLAEKVKKRPLPLEEAFPIATQIAEGLQAAHEKGIVHRDVKSANIMVTDKGQAKIMDFGLAHLGGRTKITKTGSSMGTPAYMSPEQVRGDKVDHRADIWSFGVVIYEMISGQLPFRGEVEEAVSHSILYETPEPLTALRAGVPMELDRIVSKALTKNPNERYQHIDELLVDLRALKRTQDSGLGTASVQTPTPMRRSGRWVAVAAVLALVVAGTWWLLNREGGETLPPARVVPLTSFAGREVAPSFSPDGNQVVFCWSGEGGDNWDIYVTRLYSTTPLRLTSDPDRDIVPAWSPDGRWIAFRRGMPDYPAAVYLVSPLGESERKLADLQSTAGSLSWSPDGKWIAVGETVPDGMSGIVLIPTEEGQRRQFTSRPAPFYDHSPVFSQDGRYLVYVSCAGTYIDELYLQELDEDYTPKGEPQRLNHPTGVIAGVSWAPDGHSIVHSLALEAGFSNYLWRTPVFGGGESERLELAGPNAAWPAISPTGNRLAFERLINSGRDIWKYDVGGEVTSFISTNLRDGNPQFSPDGKKIAFGSNRAGGRSAIWICDADGSNPVQLTTASDRDRGTPSWSPDGRWIAFDRQNEDGSYDIYVIDAAGGQPRQLTHDPADDNMPSWSRDGESIYFYSTRSGREEVMRIPAGGGEALQVTDNGGERPQESWDGKTVYYSRRLDDEVGGTRLAVYAIPVDGGPEREIVRPAQGFCPVEKGIYYYRPAGEGRAGEGRAWDILFYDFSTSESELLTRVDQAPSFRLSVSPDEKTILMTVQPPANGDLMLVENFR